MDRSSGHKPTVASRTLLLIAALLMLLGLVALLGARFFS